LLEELLLALLLFAPLPCEVLVTGYFIDLSLVNAREVNFVRCGNDISSIDSPERDAIDLEWTSNEENALIKNLQENDTLASETASEENENGPRGKRRSRSRWSDGLANLQL
jgi:hypothetical protein